MFCVRLDWCDDVERRLHGCREVGWDVRLMARRCRELFVMLLLI